MSNNAVHKEESQSLIEIKKELLKAIKYKNDVTVRVMIYDCSEGEKTYDVEINYYVGNEYGDGFVNQTFYGRWDEDTDDVEAIKLVKKRAKAVLRSVKGWFEYNDKVNVDDSVEMYHA